MPATPTQEKPVPPVTQPVTERAEELLTRAGRRLGLFAASASLRVQQTASVVRERAEQQTRSLKETRPPTASTDQAREESLERASEVVQQMEVRLSHLGTSLNKAFQKGTARLREEAEDIWAEAQHIRRQRRP
jgi:hypothetical protein